jgi:hypothetical protein
MSPVGTTRSVLVYVVPAKLFYDFRRQGMPCLKRSKTFAHGIHGKKPKKRAKARAEKMDFKSLKGLVN